MLTSCTGTLHITGPESGVTYTTYPLYTYPIYPSYNYHSVTYVRPVQYINKYSHHNPYYKPHCNYKTSNTYFKHRK